MRDVGGERHRPAVADEVLRHSRAASGLRRGARGDGWRPIRRRLPPWSVNTLAQAVGVAVLADADYAPAHARLRPRAARVADQSELRDDAGPVRLSRRGELPAGAPRTAPTWTRRRSPAPARTKASPSARSTPDAASAKAAFSASPCAPRRRTRGFATRWRASSACPAKAGTAARPARTRRAATDVPGNQLQRRQERPDRGALPHSASGRRARRALQGAEHVAQLVRHARRRRDGPRAGRPGAGLPPGAGRADEPDPAQAQLRYRLPGHRARQARRQHGRGRSMSATRRRPSPRSRRATTRWPRSSTR